jgi:hypothetical protein
MTVRRRYKLRPFIASDDVQGTHRAAIIAEHLAGLRDGEADTSKDFSDAPIAKWVAEHVKNLAKRRGER